MSPRASWIEAKRSGNSGPYFGLEHRLAPGFLVGNPGLDWDRVTSRSEPSGNSFGCHGRSPPKPLDQGICLGSPSTFFRVLRENGQVRERRRLAKHPCRAIPELVATAPGQVYTSM
jgi:hypothetical protein